jgi:hypothetical protein
MLLQELRFLVQDDAMLGSDTAAYWRESLFKRLDNWQSLYDLLPTYPTRIHSNGAMSQMTDERQPPDEVEEESDPELIEQLMSWEETFTEQKAAELVETYPAEQLRRCMRWIEENKEVVRSSATGLLLTMLKNGQMPEVDDGPDLSNQIPEHLKHLIQH